jgi:arabinogalactan oligomer/maltooligosaccharide transport system substrate-binding protein
VDIFFDEYVADQSEHLRVDACQYTDVAWEAAQYRGQTVGLPISGETVGLYYNEAIVDEPPETLAEMQAVMDEYQDPDSDRYGLEIHLDPYYVSGFAQAYGGEIYDEEADELGLRSDAVERGLRVFFEELGPYAVISDYKTPEPFDNGNVAFAIDGPWRLFTLSESDVEWGMTTFPTLPDGGEMRPYVGVELLVFSARVAEDPTDGAVARQFAEWYTTNTDRLRRLAETARYAPVLAELVGDSALPEPMRVFSEQCKRGYPMPTGPKMDKVWGPFGDILEPIYEDEMALTAALETAEERIREEWSRE